MSIPPGASLTVELCQQVAPHAELGGRLHRVRWDGTTCANEPQLWAGATTPLAVQTPDLRVGEKAVQHRGICGPAHVDGVREPERKMYDKKQGSPCEVAVAEKLNPFQGLDPSLVEQGRILSGAAHLLVRAEARQKLGA